MLPPPPRSTTNISPFRFIHLVRRPINVALSRFRLGWQSIPASDAVTARLANAGIPDLMLKKAGTQQGNSVP